MKRYLLIGALIGLVIPFSFWGLYWMFHYSFGEEVSWFWPSAILLLLTAGRENTLLGFGVTAFSVAINVCVYSLAGLFVYSIKTIVTKSKTEHNK